MLASMRPPLVLRLLSAATIALGLAGCGSAAPDVFAEAEALEREGKLEEAAAKFELTCAYAPKGDKCGAADGRAAEARLKAAEKAMAEGKLAAAERLFGMALFTADDATAQKVIDRLTSDDLKQGIAYERALGQSDKQEIIPAMTAIAATKTPAAARAKAWLDAERPSMLIAAVKAACGPTHEASCSRAASELSAAAVTGPEADLAIALAEAEERRIFKDRLNAEEFINNFAARSKQEKVISDCKAKPESEQTEICQNVLANDVTDDEKREKQKMNELVWRRAMKSIADPEIVAALEQRKTEAIATGESKRLTIPKPKPAPKK
jgi:hypothetical protein